MTVKPDSPSPPKAPIKPICLALQGGGAHGAFEWGVLDALLEDPHLEIKGLSGASAGAMNAVVLASGLAKGGREGARQGLATFWRKISGAGSPFGDLGFWSRSFAPVFGRDNPFVQAASAFADNLASGSPFAISPYQFNPFNFNPLREALHSAVDFAHLRQAPSVQVFVAATAVRSGRLKIFDTGVLTADHVLASACLPYLFQAVEIDGEAYWDGGFTANPPLWPLYYGDLPRDILVVNLNPFHRPTTPTDTGDIIDRLNEITFNATLAAEFRAVAFVNRLVEEEMLNAKGRAQYRPVRLHLIAAEGYLDRLALASKFNTDWGFLTELRDLGRTAAQSWRAAHFDAVGVRSSVDVRSDFL